MNPVSLLAIICTMLGLSLLPPSGICAGLGFSSGFAFWRCANLQLFLPALRRLGYAVLFRGLRPSPAWGLPFWPLGLTGQSNRPAFGGRLTFVRWVSDISWFCRGHDVLLSPYCRG